MRIVGLPSSETPLRAVKDWLENNAKLSWILILDGIDDIENAKRWIFDFPTSQNGQTIITTQDRAVLEVFRLKAETMIAIEELPMHNAIELFRGILDSEENAMDADIEAVVSIVKIPLFVKAAASYVNQYKLSGVSTRTLRSLLEKNICHMGRLDVSGSPNAFQITDSALQQLSARPMPDGVGSHSIDGLYKIFTVLFRAFMRQYTDDHGVSKDELFLLEISSCFVRDAIKPGLLEWLYGRNPEILLEHFGVHMNHSFIEAYSDRAWVMHELIQKFLLIYLEEREGPAAVLTRFRYMLVSIYIAYDKERKEQRGLEVAGMQQDSYLWKIEYMPHFEEFLAYVKKIDAHSLGDWKFQWQSALSILTFSRVFTDQNRPDDAIRVLEFAHIRGIQESQKSRDAHVRILYALSMRIEERHSGRNYRDYSERALSYADEGLEMAEAASLPMMAWRLMIQKIRILSNREDFDGAEELLQRLHDGFNPESTLEIEERTKLEQRLRMEDAFFLFKKGMSDGKKSLIIKSRKLLADFLKTLRKPSDNVYQDTDVIRRAETLLARVDAEVPLPVPLDEAERIFSNILWDLRRKYGNTVGISVIWEAEADLATVWLRNSKVNQARVAFERLKRCLMGRHDRNDGLTRNVVYGLRHALQAQEKSSLVEDLTSEFNLELICKHSRLGLRFHPENDPDPKDCWPLEWTKQRNIWSQLHNICRDSCVDDYTEPFAPLSTINSIGMQVYKL